MSTWHGWLSRLRRVWFRSRTEAEMAEEMRAHLDLDAAARVARGGDATTARRQAAIAFGHVGSYQEEVRDRLPARWLGQTLQDLRYALRLFRRAPGFAVVVIATLAVGIGANVAIFSALDAVLLRPLPYPQPDRLVQVFETLENRSPNSVSGGAFIDWRDGNTSFDGIVLVGNLTFNLRPSRQGGGTGGTGGTGGGTPERLPGLEVTHHFLRVLGLQPLLGRGFQPEDERPGGRNDVVMITEELWRSHFAAQPSIVGRAIVLDEVPRTVIGIVPRGAWMFREARFFVPSVLDPVMGRGARAGHWAEVYGRLKPGVSPERADAELKAIKKGLEPAYPAFKRRWGVTVRPLHELLAVNPRPVLLILSGAVSLVLLIACANIANLLLARASQRRQEIAVRAALGAGRLRIVRQVLTENLLLAAIGGAVGIALSGWGVELLQTITRELLPGAMTPRLDARVLAFAVVVTVATGALFGVLPAWRLRRPDLNDVLKQGGRSATSGTSHRTQSTLVVVQVALTVVLLAAAGLLLRSLANAAASDPGFEPSRVVAFDLSLPEATYGGDGGVRRFDFSRELLGRIRTLPGVEAAGAGMAIPFTGGGFGEYFMRGDRPTTTENALLGRVDFVSEGYLEALGTRLIAGRRLTAADNRAGARRLAVINQAAARLLFPDVDPVGQTLVSMAQRWEVVGVIANVVDRRLDRVHRPYAYVAQMFNPNGYSIVVRTAGDPLRAMGAVRAEVQRLDAGLPIVNVRRLDQTMSTSMQERRWILMLIGAFAAAALVLACIGLYGVMAYAVATRRRELCIRMALGAARGDVIRQILRDGFVLTALGVVIGFVGALGIARALQGMLYQVRGTDPLVIAATLILMLVVACVACWLPARRATRFNAMAALRND